MSQPGFVTIQLYYSATPSVVPLAGNLAAGEMALNTADEILYFKNSSGVVKALSQALVSPDKGGTGITSYTIGDMIYASGVTTLSKLADVAVGNALISGGVGVAPSWGKVSLTATVSGVLPLANGGTNGTDAATARTGLDLGTAATMAGPSGAIVGTTDAQTLTQKKLSGYTEATVSASIAASTYNIDLSLDTNMYIFTLQNNVTFTFTNPPASGTLRSATVMLIQDGSGSRTATFTSAKYTDGNAPTLSTGAGQIDVLAFFTVNGGTTYPGTFAMANVS